MNYSSIFSSSSLANFNKGKQNCHENVLGNRGLLGESGPRQARHRREAVRGDAGAIQDVRRRQGRRSLTQGVRAADGSPGQSRLVKLQVSTD